jgi:hypothetical protein
MVAHAGISQQGCVDWMVGEEDSEVALGPGELRRQRPATVAGSDAPTT